MRRTPSGRPAPHARGAPARVLTPGRVTPPLHGVVPTPPPLPTDAPALAREIERNLEFGVGASPGEPLTPRAAYRAVADSVRDRLIERRNATQAHWM